MNTKSSLRFEVLEARRCLSTAGILEDPLLFPVHEYSPGFPSQIECAVHFSSADTCMPEQATDLLTLPFEAAPTDLFIDDFVVHDDSFWPGLAGPEGFVDQPPFEIVHLVFVDAFVDALPSSMDYWATDQHSMDFDVDSFRSFKNEMTGFDEPVEPAAEPSFRQAVNESVPGPALSSADIRTGREFTEAAAIEPAITNSEQLQKATRGVGDTTAVQMQLNASPSTVATATPSIVAEVQTQPELTNHSDVQHFLVARALPGHTPSLTLHSPNQGSLHADSDDFGIGGNKSGANAVGVNKTSSHDNSLVSKGTPAHQDSVLADSASKEELSDGSNRMELVQPANWLNYVSLSIVTPINIEGTQVDGAAIHGSTGSQLSQLSTLARILASASNNALDFVPERGNQILVATLVAGAGVGYTVIQKQKKNRIDPPVAIQVPGDRQPTVINPASVQESNLI